MAAALEECLELFVVAHALASMAGSSLQWPQIVSAFSHCRSPHTVQMWRGSRRIIQGGIMLSILQ